MSLAIVITPLLIFVIILLICLYYDKSGFKPVENFVPSVSSIIKNNVPGIISSINSLTPVTANQALSSLNADNVKSLGPQIASLGPTIDNVSSFIDTYNISGDTSQISSLAPTINQLQNPINNMLSNVSRNLSIISNNAPSMGSTFTALAPSFTSLAPSIMTIQPNINNLAGKIITLAQNPGVNNLVPGLTSLQPAMNSLYNSEKPYLESIGTSLQKMGPLLDNATKPLGQRLSEMNQNSLALPSPPLVSNMQPPPVVNFQSNIRPSPISNMQPLQAPPVVNSQSNAQLNNISISPTMYSAVSAIKPFVSPSIIPTISSLPNNTVISPTISSLVNTTASIIQTQSYTPPASNYSTQYSNNIPTTSNNPSFIPPTATPSPQAIINNSNVGYIEAIQQYNADLLATEDTSPSYSTMTTLITDLETIVNTSTKAGEKTRATEYQNIMNFIKTLTDYQSGNPNSYSKPSREKWKDFIGLSK